MADRGTSRRRRFTVDNLFADTRPQAVGVQDLVEAKEIRLDRIRPDPSQPRQTFDEERLEELAASIRLEGVLQPIVVRYESGRDVYIVVHGERRWRASKLAGRETIPALVRDVPIERRLIQQLMENIVRDDLNAVDRASALRALKAQLRDAPWEAVAEAVGIRRSRLFQLLGTEKLPETAREDIRAGRLSEKQSRALQGLPAPAQEALREAIVEGGLPAEEARRVARRLRDEPIPDDPGALGERIRAIQAEPAPAPVVTEIDEPGSGQTDAPRPSAGDTSTAPDSTGNQSPVAVRVPPSRTDDGIRQVAAGDEPLIPNPVPPAPTLPAPSTAAGSASATGLAPSAATRDAVAWRAALDELRADEPGVPYDPDTARLAIRRLAAALRDAEGDDLRDGALTADLTALRAALDGALNA